MAAAVGNHVDDRRFRGSVLAKNGGNPRPWLDPGEQARAGNVAYCAAKAGVHALTFYLAKEVASYGVTVNAGAPGFVRTDLTQHGRGAADWAGTEERLAARAMMGRIGEPEDIANAVVFLASPEAGWITAQMLTVDGGRMDYIGDS